jgi:DNA-binding NarL/FixJ family response regulator
LLSAASDGEARGLQCPDWQWPRPLSEARHMKILVVDDHSLITDALSVLFLDLDPEAEVLTTRTAESALELQQQHPDLDLVVLDLGLPGVSGTSLLEAMVAQAPEMKILVLSGQQDPRNVMRVLQLGAAGFVPKSMASETLLSAVKFVLSGGVYIPADLLDEVNRANMMATPDRPREAGGGRIELTERQEQVLQLLARGAPIKIICRELGLSEGTVKTHVTAIYRAFGASNRTEALLAARRQGYDIG